MEDNGVIIDSTETAASCSQVEIEFPLMPYSENDSDSETELEDGKLSTLAPFCKFIALL